MTSKSASAGAALLALVVSLTLATSVSAQYIDECHYECSIVYCDYYLDYCDYECYEVCYPLRSAGAPKTGQLSGAPGLKRGPLNLITKTSEPAAASRQHEWRSTFYDADHQLASLPTAEHQHQQAASTTSENLRSIRTGNSIQIKIKSAQTGSVSLPKTLALYKTSSGAQTTPLGQTKG